MTRWLLLGVLLVAAAPAEPTLAQRKRFAQQHRMTLDLTGAEDCVKVTAPAALACSTPVWVCARGWANAMCTGSFSSVSGVSFQLHEPSDADDLAPLPMLVLEEEAGEECPECECAHDLGFTFAPGLTEAQKERELREMRKLASRLHAECIRETVARQQAERVKLKCTLLMVDPCRQEAFIRCTGKNTDVPLGRTLQFSFAPRPDGGAPLGGEWEKDAPEPAE